MTSVVLAASLAACGSDKNLVVINVADRAISKIAVEHWASVIGRGGAFTGSRGEPPRGTPTQRALALLISSNWLIDEATRRGVAAPEDAVDLALAERKRSDGAAGFQKGLEATGETLADVKFELRAELALDALHQDIESRAKRVTSEEVANFYRRNRRLFRIPEARVVDLIEHLPSARAATALVRRIGTGRRFTEVGGYHELVLLSSANGSLPGKAEVVKAIFAARPGVVSPPLRFLDGWTVFVVRRIVPAHGRPKPLAKARGEVIERLTALRRDRIANEFDREFKERWIARTGCRAEYVAPGCSRYTGPLGSYEDPFSGSSGKS